MLVAAFPYLFPSSTSRELLSYGRAKIGKLWDDIQDIVFDGYIRLDFGADFRFLQDDAKAENLTRISNAETVEKGPKLFFTVCNKGSNAIITEQKIAQQYFANFGLCSKTWTVEEFFVRSNT